MRTFSPYFAALPLLVLGIVIFASPRGYPISSCAGLEAGVRMACFQEIINEIAESGDYQKAFDVVAQAYALDSDFAANCHGSVHEIGRIAYQRFLRNEDFTFTPKAYFCAYGFYHGFMEELLAQSGGIAEAQAFCDELGKELISQTADARGACYHGIGHGTVDGTDPRLWGDAHALVSGGNKMCELVASLLPDIPQGRGPLYRCVSGAYNSLEILSQNEKYGIQSVADDPFGFCALEPEKYHEPCYTNMLPAMLRLRAEDFKKIAADIDAIPRVDDGTKAGFVLDLFHEFIRIHIGLGEGKEAALGALPLCRSMSAPSHLGCIEGLAGGYLKYGPPEREAEGMLYFCGLSELSDDEKERCFRYGLTRLRNFYSIKETQGICSRAPESVQRFCTRG